jgi:Bifunctional DNA primase/polymerase, N-terminal
VDQTAAIPDFAEIEAYRLRLRAAGFPPVPVNGKAVLLKGWQRLGGATEHEIRRWSRARPHETNTGILTRLTPPFDIDILDPEAVDAIVRLLRDPLEDPGLFPVRYGRPPRCAILTRTDEPFEKYTINLTAPDGSEGQKLELLGDGQQLVVAGIHPDTGRAYSWHGDSRPGDFRREDLTLIRFQQGRDLFEAAAELLIRDYGYRRADDAKPKTRARANGANSSHGPVDWTIDFNDHASLVAGAMKS